MLFYRFNHGRGYWGAIVLATALFIWATWRVIDIIQKPDTQENLNFKTFAGLGAALGFLPILLLFGFLEGKI